MILAFHLLVIQASTWVPVPSDTPFKLIYALGQPM